MANPWRDKVLAFNAKRKKQAEKAADLDALVQKLRPLISGILKNFLPDDALVVLKKYGYKEE